MSNLCSRNTLVNMTDTPGAMKGSQLQAFFEWPNTAKQHARPTGVGSGAHSPHAEPIKA